MCTYCGKVGHIFKDCRARQRHGVQERRGRDIRYPRCDPRDLHHIRQGGIQYEIGEVEYPKWEPPAEGFSLLNREHLLTVIRVQTPKEETAQKRVRIKEEP